MLNKLTVLYIDIPAASDLLNNTLGQGEDPAVAHYNTRTAPCVIGHYGHLQQYVVDSSID